GHEGHHNLSDGRSFPVFRLLSRIFGQKAGTKRRNLRKRGLRLECLEERRVMSANLVGGDLVITQSPGPDTAVVSVSLPVSFPVLQFPQPSPRALGAFGSFGIFVAPQIKVEETINGVVQAPQFFSASSITGRIIYDGGRGNDKFDNQTSLPSTAHGG